MGTSQSDQSAKNFRIYTEKVSINGRYPKIQNGWFENGKMDDEQGVARFQETAGKKSDSMIFDGT